MVKRASRWDQVFTPSVDRAPRRTTRWRSFDLRGPLPLKTTRALEVAIQSLPGNTPWPEIDEEAWWKDVLADRRLRAPRDKRISEQRGAAGLRLDCLPCEALSFSCRRCGQQCTATVAELSRRFGSDRNVKTVGTQVLKCPAPHLRREGGECPITYGASYDRQGPS